MKYLLNLTVFTLFLGLNVGCGGDDPVMPSDCDGVLVSGEQMTVDGETLGMSVAQLLTTSGFDGVVYQFQVGGISSDCGSSKIVSMVIEIPTGDDLEGTYNIVDFFDAGLNDFYGVMITDQVFNPISQSSTEISTGTIEVTRHAEKEFTIEIMGTKVTGGEIDINFRKAF